MNKYILSALLVLPFTSMMSFGQNKLGDVDVSGELLTRGEMQQGKGTLRAHDDKPATFISERARVGVDWKNDNLEVKVSAQHTGVFGDTPQNNTKGDITLNEAWAKYSFLNDNAFVQVGRQALVYDDERLLGADDWNMAGRHHDAFKMVYQHGAHQVHIIGAFNRNDESTKNNYYTGNTAGYKSMQMIWYHCQVKGFGASALFLNHGIEVGTEKRPETRYMKTMGTYLTYGDGKSLIAADASVYYQFGKDRVNRTTKAYLISANAEIRPLKGLTIGGGGDYISGTAYGTLEQNTFNTLYGSSHNFYGAMDYFTNTTMPTQGLIALNANAGYTFNEKTNISVDYYAFGIPKAYHYTGTGPAPGRKVGHEVDIQGGYQLHHNLHLQAGYSIVFPLRTMGLLKPTGDTGAWQHWAWIMTSIKI